MINFQHNKARIFSSILILCATVFVHGCAISEIFESQTASESNLRSGFVYVDQVVPGVVLDLRYASKNNFIGDVIDGYEAPKCILTRESAEALGKVQEELNVHSMSLKIYDAYRPQRAVDHFVRWSMDLSDQRMKKEYYPNVDKDIIFRSGYIWSKSNHSKGSTVDLTIVFLPEKRELDMGSNFDFFGVKSSTAFDNIKPEQRANRLLLKSIMEKHGFVNYEREWWHYTLKNEPFPHTYFNFPVK